MKYIVVPALVTLTNTITKEPLKYGKGHPLEGQLQTNDIQKFNQDNFLNHPGIGKGMDAVRRVLKLEKAFENARPGDLIGVEDADYSAVMKITAEAEFQFPMIAAQLLPFFEAWEAGAKQDEEWKRKQTLKAVSTSAE